MNTINTQKRDVILLRNLFGHNVDIAKNQNICEALTAKAGMGGNNVPLVMVKKGDDNEKR